jgi:hypothetical protein
MGGTEMDVRLSGIDLRGNPNWQAKTGWSRWVAPTCELASKNRPQSMGGTRIGTKIDGWHHAQTDYRKPAKRKLAGVDGWHQHGTGGTNMEP